MYLQAKLNGVLHTEGKLKNKAMYDIEQDIDLNYLSTGNQIFFFFCSFRGGKKVC